MKIAKRTLVILAAALLIILVGWAATNVVSLASMPTDTMELPVKDHITDTANPLMALGSFKNLVIIAAVVLGEQAIEALLRILRRNKKAASILRHG
jgi:purine-cytosine permease-like protein